MPIAQSRILDLCQESLTNAKHSYWWREQIQRLLDLEKTEPSTRESMISMLNYLLQTAPISQHPKADLELHLYRIHGKRNARMKEKMRRKRAGLAQQADMDRESRLKDDLDFFLQPSPARGAEPEGGEAIPSADEGFPALDIKDL